MPRDYKQPAAKRKSAPRPLGSWVSFTSGLMLGLFVAVLALLYGDRVAPLLRLRPEPPAATQPIAATAEMATPTPRPEAPRPRFDFYKILPEMEVEVPIWQLDKTPAATATDTFDGDNYILQVGSFQAADEAERAKALLALQGIRASIQKVDVNGGDTWYRVNVGPFGSREEIHAARARLSQNGVDAVLLKRLGE
jgi:cell division protein FtsN